MKKMTFLRYFLVLCFLLLHFRTDVLSIIQSNAKGLTFYGDPDEDPDIAKDPDVIKLPFIWS